MNLRPYRTKRRVKRADIWGVKVRSDIRPTALAPNDRAKHEVTLENKDSLTYKLVVEAQCGPLLRYGSNGTWGPHERTLLPGQKTPLEGEIDLPTSSDQTQLPCWEQVAVRTDAEPLDPRILGQQASVYHDINLTK